MSLSLFWTFDRADGVRAECNSSALLYSHSCLRSGRSPALPYSLHELLYFSTLAGGIIFDVKKQNQYIQWNGALLLLVPTISIG